MSSKRFEKVQHGFKRVHYSNKYTVLLVFFHAYNFFSTVLIFIENSKISLYESYVVYREKFSFEVEFLEFLMIFFYFFWEKIFPFLAKS